RVYVATFGGHIRICEAITEFLDLLGTDLLLVFGTPQLALINNVYRPLRAHDGDLGCRPGVVHVGTDVLGSHHAVGAAIGLARDYRDLGDGGLGESKQQFSTVLDYASVLLVSTGEKTRDVLKRNQRNIETVA